MNSYFLPTLRERYLDKGVMRASRHRTALACSHKNLKFYDRSFLFAMQTNWTYPVSTDISQFLDLRSFHRFDISGRVTA